jgi:hypothetical protein
MTTDADPIRIAFSKPNRRSAVIVAWVGLMTGSGNLASAQQVLYVDANATGPIHDGSSWCNAFRHLEDALPIVQQGSTIRIADGVYVPPASGSSDPREATFKVIGGVGLYGGFAGCGSPDPGERDFQRFETVLSGDLHGDDDLSGSACAGSNCCVVHQGPGCDDDICESKVCQSQPACCDPRLSSWFPECVGLAKGLCCQEYSTQSKCENAYHVVTRDYRPRDYKNILLDGLTITGGYALGSGVSVGLSPNHWGGGLSDFGFNTILRNCRFVDNHAIYGGAVTLGSRFSIDRCTFVQNGAQYSGALHVDYSGDGDVIRDSIFVRNHAWDGGAVGLYQSRSRVVLDGCRFEDNRADHWGGAVMNSWGFTTAQNCVFIGNHAGLGGGALSVFGFDSIVHHSSFTENSAMDGGAVLSRAEIKLTDSVFYDNYASSGGAIWHGEQLMNLSNCTLTHNMAEQQAGGAHVLLAGELQISNSILWGNEDSTGQWLAAQVLSTGGTLSVNFSCVQGASSRLSGSGNIDADPRFAQPNHSDFRLSFGSPCIDAGDSEAVAPEHTTDLAGNQRIVNDPATPDTGHGNPPVVDMGAYEYQPVYLDILPGECPNELNPRRFGTVRIAVVGTPTFEVWRINTTSLALSRADGVGGVVKPIHRRSGPVIRFADVARPVDADLCACGTGGDGVTDYVLSLSARDLIDTLELDSAKPDSAIRLLLTGSLLDGSLFSAADCVTIISPRRVGGR